MPKLDRWIIASKMVKIFDKETLQEIINLDGHIGGGWCQIHQHISVNSGNKEKIEKLLTDKGFNTSSSGDTRIAFPECHTHDISHH